jgi:VanZ family protein
VTRRTALRCLPALLWMALIWASSSRPWTGGEQLLAGFPRWLLAVLATVGPDKIVHTGIYALLAGLWRWGLAGAGARPLWLAFGLSTGFGALDEWHQSHVPGRNADLRDLAADAFGAALALAVLYAAQRRQIVDATAGQQPALDGGPRPP